VAVALKAETVSIPGCGYTLSMYLTCFHLTFFCCFIGIFRKKGELILIFYVNLTAPFDPFNSLLQIKKILNNHLNPFAALATHQEKTKKKNTKKNH